MAFLDEVGEELQEEGDDKQTDVHSVDIGIGSHDNLVVTQRVETVLYVEGCLEKIELLVLVHHFLGKTKAVERLTAKGEHSLGVHVAALGDASAGRIALCNEDGAFLLAFVLGVAEMDAVVQIGLLGTLARQLGDASHRLSLALTLLDLALQHLGHVFMDVQIVVHLFLQKIAHILVDGLAAIGSHRGTAELDLRLTLEDGFFDIDGYSCHQTVANVAILVLTEEFLDGLGNVLLEGALMSSALRGVLTVDKGIVLLAILVGVGESHLDVLALHVDDVVETVIGHVVGKKILQTVTAQDATTIVHDGKARIEIGVVAKHRLHDVIVEAVVLEESVVGLEKDVGSVLILGL